MNIPSIFDIKKKSIIKRNQLILKIYCFIIKRRLKIKKQYKLKEKERKRKYEDSIRKEGKEREGEK